MLKRIRIRGYKSLVDLDVKLNPLSVLFGPNAAGKSNFLDALQLLSRIATSRTLREAFAPPYRGTPLESFTFGPDGIRGQLAQEGLSFEMEADVELSPMVVNAVNRQIQEMKKTKATDEEAGTAGKSLSFVREKFLRYRVKIEIFPKSGILRVADEYLAALTVNGDISGSRKPFLELVDNQLHLRMEGRAHPSYHDLHLDHTMLSKSVYAPHYPHVVAMQQELSNWLFFYFEPRERMRAPTAVKEVRHIGLMGEELAGFLNTLRALDEPQFRAIEKSLHLIIPEVTGLDVGVNDLGEVELRLLERGVPIPARVVSEGTLRMLGLLALVGAKESPALLGFEEPENGVHPRRIRLIAELLKNRVKSGGTQIIATTHSPILPDLIPDDSLFVCHKVDGLTEIEPFATWGPLGRQIDIDVALDGEEAPLTVADRILRGDFDA